MGAAVAWFLRCDVGFDGTVAVVETDMSYARSGTALTNSCVRQQFSEPINVKISQYAVEFVKDFPTRTGDPSQVLHTDYFGYLYLAADSDFAAALQQRQVMQNALGADTLWLEAGALAKRFPFLRTDDLIGASYNPTNEGYFDSGTMVDTWRRQARQAGAEWIHDTVVSLERKGQRIHEVGLGSGHTLSTGFVVNAAGTRAAAIAAMAGIALPVEARKRYTYILDLAQPLSSKLPLTIDPSGVHARSDGEAYMVGVAPDDDIAVEPDDFAFDDDVFEDKVWPTLVARIEAFERVKVRSRWVGHYAYNTFDQNAIVGLHPEIDNLFFLNGFSGHGIQQAPAMGRGTAEYLTTGAFRTLDLSPLGFQRILDGSPRSERAVI